MSQTISRRHILGVPVDGYTYTTWLAEIELWLSADSTELQQICTVNPEFLVMAQTQPEFLALLNRAAMCVPDGIGLVWAARHLGQPLPGRVTGSDGLPKLAEMATQHGWRLFFLGAAEGVAEIAAERLRSDYPNVNIVGTYAGSPNDADAPAIIEMVNASQADILLVAYGAPRQDLWIDQHRAGLQVKVAMGVGGSFDFIAGVVPRAPQWMRKTGVEWLFRLYKQPWRWRRMLRLPLFMWYVVRYRHNPTPKAR